MDPTQQLPGAPAVPNPMQAAMQQAMLLQAIRGATQQQQQQQGMGAQAAGMGQLNMNPGAASGGVGSGMGAGTPPAIPVDPNAMTGGLGSQQPMTPFSQMSQTPNPVANALMFPIPGSQ